MSNNETLTVQPELTTLTLNITDSSHGSVNLDLSGDDRVNLNLQGVGLQGPPGVGTEPYIHTQTAPLSIWTLIHNRGHLADVTVYDDDGHQIIGDIHHDTDNIATITFSIPVSGIARVD